MVSVDQFLKALAVTESADDPEAWGDAGRAMGRWQVHPDRLWSEARLRELEPHLGETWDQFVACVLRAVFAKFIGFGRADVVAMYWHVGHLVHPTDPDWDQKYAERFGVALMQAQEEMP